jgi:hypothetical protein
MRGRQSWLTPNRHERVEDRNPRSGANRSDDVFVHLAVEQHKVGPIAMQGSDESVDGECLACRSDAIGALKKPPEQRGGGVRLEEGVEPIGLEGLELEPVMACERLAVLIPRKRDAVSGDRQTPGQLDGRVDEARQAASPDQDRRHGA